MGIYTYCCDFLLLNIETLIRLLLAMLLGGIIGLERGKLNRPAGVRTHMIVCMGSALIMLLGIYMQQQDSNIDVTRLGAQVVSGIGFLGAGAILKDGFSVRGLTTAATLWVVGCVGLSIGGGYYIAGIFTTLLVYISLQFIGNNSIKCNIKILSIYVKSVDASIEKLHNYFKNRDIQIEEINLIDSVSSKSKELKFAIALKNVKILKKLEKELLEFDEVISIHIE